MASFYSLVGGDCESLFFDNPHSALSYIYKSLGCFHTLQPERDPYALPSLPALTPQGFVRWQTMQLLLCPGRHVRYLQEALKRFEIQNPGEGGPFPKFLPAESLPKRPDIEVSRWYDRVAAELRPASEAQQAPKEASQMEDVESMTDSSIDSRSMVDAADYFHPHPTSPLRPRGYVHVIPESPPARRPRDWQDSRSSSYRRRSAGDHDPHWHRDGPTPTNGTHHRSPPSTRRRTPPARSSASESDVSDDSSTTSEGSRDPVHRPRDHRPPAGRVEYGRRHSAAHAYDPQPHPRPANHRHSHTLSPQFYISRKPISPRSQSHGRPQAYAPSAPPAFYPASQQRREAKDAQWRYVGPREANIPDGSRRAADDSRRAYGERRRRGSMEAAASSSSGQRYPSEERHRRWKTTEPSFATA
jgi:hypothetical protein